MTTYLHRCDVIIRCSVSTLIVFLAVRNNSTNVSPPKQHARLLNSCLSAMDPVWTSSCTLPIVQVVEGDTPWFKQCRREREGNCTPSAMTYPWKLHEINIFSSSRILRHVLRVVKFRLTHKIFHPCWLLLWLPFQHSIASYGHGKSSLSACVWQLIRGW